MSNRLFLIFFFILTTGKAQVKHGHFTGQALCWYEHTIVYLPVCPEEDGAEITAAIPPMICIGENCPQPDTEPRWLHFVMDSPYLFLMDMSLLKAVIVVAVIALCACLLWIQSTYNAAEHVLFVCICTPSARACKQVYQELDCARPLLERLYGPLQLNHDPHFTYASIVVCPRLATANFRLKQFVKDVLGMFSYDKNFNGRDFKVLVRQASSKDVHKTWFKKSVLRQKFADNGMEMNAGRFALRLASGAEAESALLGELVRSKKSLETFFTSHHLQYKGSRKGSVKIRFNCARDSNIFNTLAEKDAVRKLVTDLLGHQSFQQLRRPEDLQFEFIFKSSVSRVAVIQTEQLAIQIGINNHITIGEVRAPHEGETESGYEDSDNKDKPVEYPSTVQETQSDFVSYYVYSIPGQAVSQAREEDAAVGQRKAIHVSVRCDECRAEQLHKEWSKLYDLLKRLWPGCRLCKSQGKVWWELAAGDDKCPEVSKFIGDLFLHKRLKKILEEHEIGLEVCDVSVNQLTGEEERRPREICTKRNTRWTAFICTMCMGFVLPTKILGWLIYSLAYSGILEDIGLVNVGHKIGCLAVPFIWYTRQPLIYSLRLPWCKIYCNRRILGGAAMLWIILKIIGFVASLR